MHLLRSSSVDFFSGWSSFQEFSGLSFENFTDSFNLLLIAALSSFDSVDSFLGTFGTGVRSHDAFLVEVVFVISARSI